jgi:hypothetical protein
VAQTKRPHFVPAGYLRAWADDADQVAVRRRGSADVHTPNVINVAVDAGIYGRGACGQAREDMFKQLEDMWPLLRANLLARGGTLTSDDRDAVAVFAALQLVRTREHVAQTEFLASFAEFTSRRPVTREDMRTYLTERHLKSEPSDSEVEGAWTLAYGALKNGPPPSKDETLAVSLDAAVRVIAPTLARLRWSVEHCRKPILFTSDRPVMCWQAPSARDHYEGVGIDTATEIRMPLTPYDLLAMRPDGFNLGVVDVQPKRFQRINAGVATQCHEFLLSLPARQAELRQLPLASYRPVLRFNIAPGVRQRPDGTHEPIGDVVHSWIPTHATYSR